MRGLNKVMLIGHLGKDPEVTNLESGVTVAKFSMATSESYKDKDGQRVDQTEWHNIVVWRKLAEIAEQYLKKGSLIFLEGKIRSRSWDDKDGNKKYMTEIVADNFTMLDKKEGLQPSQQQEAVNTVEEPSAEQKSMDDLPF